MVLMTPLLLVLAAAVLHGWWNYLVKRDGSDDVVFLWCYSALSMPMCALALLWWRGRGGGMGPAWWAGGVSTILHTAYAVILQRAYSRADMSVVYPVSRGLAPVLVTLTSLAWVSPPSTWGWTGMAIVVMGVVCASGLGAMQASGVRLGAFVAAATAAYTVWDAFAAQVLHVEVIPYMALSSVAQGMLLTGVLWQRRAALIPALRLNWRTALPVCVLIPLSYALVMLAFRWGTPSLVSTARSLNVVTGSLFAIVLLRERPSRTVILGIALICVGATVSAA